MTHQKGLLKKLVQQRHIKVAFASAAPWPVPLPTPCLTSKVRTDTGTDIETRIDHPGFLNIGRQHFRNQGRGGWTHLSGRNTRPRLLLPDSRPALPQGIRQLTPADWLPTSGSYQTFEALKPHFSCCPVAILRRPRDKPTSDKSSAACQPGTLKLSTRIAFAGIWCCDTCHETEIRPVTR